MTPHRHRPPRYIRVDGTPTGQYPRSGSGILIVVVVLVALMVIGLLFGRHGLFSASASIPLATWRVKGRVDTGPASFPNFRVLTVEVKAQDLVAAALEAIPRLQHHDPQLRGVVLLQVTRIHPRITESG